MKAPHCLHAITHAPWPRATTAVVAAALAVVIDLLLRFSAYRALFDSFPVFGIMKFSAVLTLGFLQVAALFYLITLLPRILRAPVLLPSVFIIALQFSYWQTLSQFMTGTDMYLALTVGGPDRAAAILSFFKPLIIVCALPYALVLAGLLLAPPAPAFRTTIARSILPALYLLASNYVFFLHVPERSFHLNPLTSFVRSTLHCKFANLHSFNGPRDDLPAFHVSGRPPDSIIYVIDESVRGSNLSLNGYPRATTPFLQTLETMGLLKNFGICVAASSFSHISNAYLITGHKAFPDDEFRTAKNPTIFDYAKSMGYETIYIDINNGYLPLLVKAARGGPVRSLDRMITDQWFKERHIDLATTRDMAIARVLSSFLNERGGYFILVNKQGLHFQYRNRYPDDPAATMWKPVMEKWESIDPGAAGREKLVNTYDNAIRFQVDEFFRMVVSETTNSNYVILYTSDHGQTLAEQGQVYTHMMPDPVIADVPNFLVAGEQYSKKELLDGIAPGIRVSHLNNFATLLDLMGVPMSLRVRSYDTSIFYLTAVDNNLRYYMSGALHGLGDYVVKTIPTPPDAGWGVSRPVSRQSVQK